MPGTAWNRRLRNWLPILLLLIFFGLGMAQVRTASITFDEGPHLAIGYATLRTGDFRLQPIHIHPPLANVLAALPLLVQHDLPDPSSVDGWQINSLSAITDAVVWQYPQPFRIATAGRLPILLLGLLLCALVARWASDLGGRPTGLLALALCALDPNIIAHSAVITTDAAATTLTVATLYALYRAYRASSPPYALRAGTQPVWLAVSGILLGLAQLTKVSALMLVPVAAVIIALASWARTHSIRRAIWTALRSGMIVFTAATIVLWAGYGFEIAEVPEWSMRLPAATHIRIFLSLREHYDLGHPTFAFGRVSDQGWWWYFPAAFLIKTPLPTLILLLISGLAAARRLITRRRSTEPPRAPTPELSILPLASLMLFPLLYAISSLFSTVNIGYRHLLPVLPFLFIGVAKTMAQHTTSEQRASIVARLGSLGLVSWLAIGTILITPNYLTFFNGFVGGPAHGYQYLVDSNLDWGQDLGELATWLDAHNDDELFYAHYSPADPQVYGIAARFLPPDPRAVAYAPWHPEPGFYAIGATVLQGPYAPDLNTYAWFRDRDPVAVLGNALFIYEVPPKPAPQWAVVCEPSITDAEVERRLGTGVQRTIRPNCQETDVYPEAIAPGLYVLPSEATPPVGSSPLLSLRNHIGGTSANLYTASAFAARQDLIFVDDVSIDGPLDFLGYALEVPEAGIVPEATIVLRTAWEVVDIPGRPLSLMAHALDGEGNLVAVGDGLGFPIEQWQMGDRFIETHRLVLPGDDETIAPALTLETGGYWLDSMERWPVDGAVTSIALTTVSTGKSP